MDRKHVTTATRPRGKYRKIMGIRNRTMQVMTYLAFVHCIEGLAGRRSGRTKQLTSRLAEAYHKSTDISAGPRRAANTSKAFS